MIERLFPTGFPNRLASGPVDPPAIHIERLDDRPDEAARTDGPPTIDLNDRPRPRAAAAAAVPAPAAEIAAPAAEIAAPAAEIAAPAAEIAVDVAPAEPLAETPPPDAPATPTRSSGTPLSLELAAGLGLPATVPIVAAPAVGGEMPGAEITERSLPRARGKEPAGSAGSAESDESDESDKSEGLEVSELELADAESPKLAGSLRAAIDDKDAQSAQSAPGKRSLFGAILVIGHVLLLNALNLPLMVFMARRMGELGVGQWGAATELAALASLLTTLGLRPLFVRTVAQNPDDAGEELAYQLGLRGLLTFAACAIAVGAAFALQYPPIVLTCVAISAGSMMISTLAMTFADLLQGLDRMNTYSAVNFVSGISLIAASGYALYRDPTPVSIAIAYTVGPITGLLMYVAVSARHAPVRVRFSLRKFRELLRESRTIAAYQISVVVRDRLERVLLPKLSGLSSFGHYYMGVMPADRLFVIPEGFVTAFFPAISRSHHQDEKSASHHVLHLMVTSIVACAPLALLVTYLADPISRLLFKQNPTLCRDVISITIWAVPLRALQLPMGSSLQASGRHALAAKTGIAATFVSLGITIALILTMGIRGACWAFVARAGISALFLAPAFVRTFPGVGRRLPVMRILLGLGVMAGLLWGSSQVRLDVSHWTLLGGAVATATLAYFLSMVLLRVIEVSDLKFMFRRRAME